MVKPILFNTEMVRAILGGRKTVTRRVVRGAWPDWSYLGLTDDAAVTAVDRYGEEYPKPVDGLWAEFEDADGPVEFPMVKTPYHPGDVLWVRETWNRGYIDSSDAELSNESWFEEYYKRDGSHLDGISGYVYRADFTSAEEYELGTLDEDSSPKPMPWRPSIHMPREAARIFLRVTDVRVERLQDMTEDDVVDEGAEPLIQCPNEHRVYDGSGSLIGMCWNDDVCSNGCYFISKSYGELFGKIIWDSTIKSADRERYGWEANPFCWVISFERISKDEAMQ